MARLFNRTTQREPRSPMSTTLPVSLFAALQPRKSRYRSTLIILAILLCLSTYLLARSSSSPSHTVLHKDMPTVAQPVAVEEARNTHGPGATRKHRKVYKFYKDREQVTLDPSQELAAISSFLASLPQNVIPLSVDPLVTIDPQLVLDFDTRSARAAEEVQHMVADVWLRNPVFLYSKLYSPASREIKAMLTKMDLWPTPTIIDVDIRDDAEVLQPIIRRLTSSPELPVLLISGKPVGSIKEVRLLEKSGELRKLVAASGAVIDGSKKKQYRH